MIRLDRDAWICDLAETYHIYDPEALSVEMLARLSCGLRNDSRIKMKMTGAKASLDTILQMAILDEVRWLKWSKTKDAVKNRNMPKRLLDAVLNGESDEKPTSFQTPEEFEQRRREILRGA